MPHTAADIHAHLHHVASQHGHIAKNAALFKGTGAMIAKSVAEAAVLGATPAQLAVFSETQTFLNFWEPILVRAPLTDRAAKEALDHAIRSSVLWSVAKAKAAGATDATMAPFTDALALFAAEREKVLATDMS